MWGRISSNGIEPLTGGLCAWVLLRIWYRVGIVSYVLKRHHSLKERYESVLYWFCSDIIVTNDEVCNIPWHHQITHVCNKLFSHSHHHTCLYSLWATLVCMKYSNSNTTDNVCLLFSNKYHFSSKRECVVWDKIRLDTLHRVRVGTYGVPTKTR